MNLPLEMGSTLHSELVVISAGIVRKEKIVQKLARTSDIF